MNKSLLSICILFLITQCFSEVISPVIAQSENSKKNNQETKKDILEISEDGQLIISDANIKLDPKNVKVDISKFEKKQGEYKRELLKDIVARLTATKDSLEKHREKHALLVDVDMLKKRYSEAADTILKILNSKDGSLPKTYNFNFKDMYFLGYVLNDVLNKKVSVELKKGTGYVEIDLYRPLYANLFYSEYYKKIFENRKENNIYQNLSIDDFYTLIQSFEKLLNHLIDGTKKGDQTRAALAAYELQDHVLYKLFCEDWLTDLLWLTKGQPNLNPFDPYTPVAYQLSKYSNADSIYLEYLQHQVDQKRESDSSGKYNDFKSLLAEWQIYKSGEMNRKERDSLKSAQKKQFEALKTSFAYMNKIKSPLKDEKKEVTVKRVISASNAIDEDEDVKDEGFLGPKQKKIRWLVHNVRNDQQVEIRLIKKTTLNAQGIVERGFADAVGHLLDVYSLLNPYGAIFNSLRKTVQQPHNTKSNRDVEIIDQNTNKNRGDSAEWSPSQLTIPWEELIIIQKNASLYLEILKGSSLPPKPWNLKKEDKPLMQTKFLNQEITEDLTEYHYKVQAISKKDTIDLDALKFKRGKYTRWHLSAGIYYTFGNHTSQHLLTDAAGSRSFEKKSQDYGGMVALNYYPFDGGMLRPDDNIVPKTRVRSRIFIQGAVGIPKPVDNLLIGLGYNLGPSFLVSGGRHFYSVKKYNILNNQVIDDNQVYHPSWYMSITIDPALLAKALGLFGGGEK